ncbi:glycosyltransferase [Leptolyngbyaceae cyanobacterium CCMR0082]|uniref:Glycosyltransferase n=2 Tax=Adonisia turfae TaxID=2950184 RepID=A0A6M0SHZ9_9CYAN|nr:glycosyltransferase [Adonisia turfae]MDV3347908.1 glycosyltransferase [Leptothoe sp. LEGE 181152]NEZ60026.1 glycosyltransferase [Adonisia turfae CCMR0081]NEZ67643.1 glycosyltransferase [Adonisia turfae CCMR0082]
MPKPFISLFIPNLDGGGAERVMLHLAEGFAERGFAVDLVVAKAEGAYLSNIPDNIRLINLEAKSPVLLFKTLALKQYLKQEQPAFLISTLDIFSSATWAKLLAGVNTRVVMCVQTNLSQQFQDRHAMLMQKIKWAVVKRFYPWADAIVTASEGVARDLEQHTQISMQQMTVIHNPVVTSDFTQKAQETIAHPWFEEGQPPVLLGVGRIVKQKSFATLVQAFALVRKQHPARLMILGDVDPREPEVKPELDALIEKFGLQDDVLFLGFVENPYAYMARANVFVLSSIYEGFGNVVAEAIAAGTPVVSTDCESGPAEILNKGQYGALVPVGNYEAMANAIVSTLKDPMDTTVLKARSQAFTIDCIVRQYLDVLNSLQAMQQTTAGAI